MADFTYEQVMTALRAADAAGNVDDARRLAALAQEKAKEIAPSEKPEPSLLAKNIQVAKDITGGLVRGAGSIGATFLYPADKIHDLVAGDRGPNITGLVTGKQPLSRNEERRLKIDQELSKIGVNTEGAGYTAGKISGEIAGTAGVGGLLANGLARVPVLAANAPNVINAVRTGGMVAGPGGGMAARIAGGAVTGGVSAGLVDPSQAGTGAAIGAVLPPVAKAAGWLGSTAGRAIWNSMTPEVQRRAVQISEMTGEPLDKVASALRANVTGPSLIPGSQRTVPQILQNPEISQIARTLKNQGQYGLAEREALNSAAQVGALERVAPTMGTINDARANVGNAISNFAIPAEKRASENVNNLFNAVPRDEAKMFLPITEMEAAKGRYLGRGTFGKGNLTADEAIATAKKIGQEPVKRAGVSDFEILAARQNGIIATIKNRFGLTDSQIQKGIVEGDKIALDKIHEGLTQGGGGYTQLVGKDTEYLRNMISDEFSHLFDVKKLGRKIDPTLMHYPDDVGNLAAQMTKAEEIARYGAPSAAERVRPVAVPFDELQGLRSSIGEKITEAQANGRKQLAAALTEMKNAIDSKISSTVIGPRAAGEVFTPNAANIYGDALAAHSAKKLQFNTGPQAAMFRKGMDGLPAKEGAEIAPLFWNSGNAQIENMRSFKGLVGGDDRLIGLLKQNATTEALQQSAKGPSGALTFAAFDKWMKNHSGAAKELFSPQELATLKAIQNETRIAASAEDLGRATGSNTAQNIFSMGALDNKLLNAGANYGPMKYLTGPALAYIKKTSAENRNAILSGLLENPEKMAKALDESAKRGSNSKALVGLLASPVAEQALYRAAPVIGANH
jgi:hypothetical protein